MINEPILFVAEIYISSKEAFSHFATNGNYDQRLFENFNYASKFDSNSVFYLCNDGTNMINCAINDLFIFFDFANDDAISSNLVFGFLRKAQFRGK